MAKKKIARKGRATKAQLKKMAAMDKLADLIKFKEAADREFMRLFPKSRLSRRSDGKTPICKGKV